MAEPYDYMAHAVTDAYDAPLRLEDGRFRLVVARRFGGRLQPLAIAGPFSLMLFFPVSKFVLEALDPTTKMHRALPPLAIAIAVGVWLLALLFVYVTLRQATAQTVLTGDASGLSLSSNPLPPRGRKRLAFSDIVEIERYQPPLSFFATGGRRVGTEHLPWTLRFTLASGKTLDLPLKMRAEESARLAQDLKAANAEIDALERARKGYR